LVVVVVVVLVVLVVVIIIIVIGVEVVIIVIIVVDVIIVGVVIAVLVGIGAAEHLRLGRVAGLFRIGRGFRRLVVGAARRREIHLVRQQVLAESLLEQLALAALDDLAVLLVLILNPLGRDLAGRRQHAAVAERGERR